MNLFRKAAKFVGNGLHGINFWFLMVYAYMAFKPFESFAFLLALIALGPLFIFIGIKFFTKITFNLITPAILYASLFFLMHSEAWFVSLLLLGVGYVLASVIGNMVADVLVSEYDGVTEANALNSRGVNLLNSTGLSCSSNTLNHMNLMSPMCATDSISNS